MASSTRLADLVRSMNCYYSNLIEGHDTHPLDIERRSETTTARSPRNAICKKKPSPTSKFKSGLIMAVWTNADGG